MKITATTEDPRDRLDRWLACRLPDLSRSRIQSLVKAGFVTLDGKPIRSHATVKPGMTVNVEIPPPVPSTPKAEAIPLDILYEDADLIVIDKPAGRVVHPAPGHATGTLVHALLHHCRDLAGIGGELRPGIVHRLDKDTSGVLVAAKNDPAMQGLTAQFKQRKVRKEYLALVWGQPAPPAGRVETGIERSRQDRKKMAASLTSGRPAVTAYETLESFGFASLVKVRIETGRTHQIRVHMAYVGYPVLGDPQYRGRHPRALPAGLPTPTRQMLHAERLSFTHPMTGARLDFRAPLPADMKELLSLLRQSVEK